MTPIQEPITGKEDLTDLSRPQLVVAQFYRAFNLRDIVLMQENWLPTSEAVMDNPLGGIKRGWSEIEVVYRSIFEGSSRVQVEFYDYTVHSGNEYFYVIGRERGTLRTATGIELELAIRTSRFYRQFEGRWRQAHHHGSIDDPSLLQRYRDLVLKAA